MIQDVEAELLADTDPFGANDDPPAANNRDGEDDGALNAENPTNDEEIDEAAQATKRRKSLKPRPKLDADRLCGSRGIATLPKIFANVEFKGAGHEVHDLRELMTNLEHWAHRLMPSMSFDDVLLRCEALGSKKPVQAYMNKIRLDMPLVDEDFLRKDIDDNADEIEKNLAENNEENEMEMENFDNLNEMPSARDFEDGFDTISHPISPSFATAETNATCSPKKLQPLGILTNEQRPSSLTDEQRQRMEMQRQKALELRRQRETKRMEETEATIITEENPKISNSASPTMAAQTNEEKTIDD